MLLGMKVRLLMSRQVIRVTVTDTVREAAKRMRDDGVSALPVMNGEDLVGILTERDLVDALIGGADPRSALVSAYMTWSGWCRRETCCRWTRAAARLPVTSEARPWQAVRRCSHIASRQGRALYPGLAGGGGGVGGWTAPLWIAKRQISFSPTCSTTLPSLIV
jgi:hypothetical protein